MRMRRRHKQWTFTYNSIEEVICKLNSFQEIKEYVEKNDLILKVSIEMHRTKDLFILKVELSNDNKIHRRNSQGEEYE
jgi:hypothetical protein